MAKTWKCAAGHNLKVSTKAICFTHRLGDLRFNESWERRHKAENINHEKELRKSTVTRSQKTSVETMWSKRLCVEFMSPARFFTHCPVRRTAGVSVGQKQPTPGSLPPPWPSPTRPSLCPWAAAGVSLLWAQSTRKERHRTEWGWQLWGSQCFL